MSLEKLVPDVQRRSASATAAVSGQDATVLDELWAVLMVTCIMIYSVSWWS